MNALCINSKHLHTNESGGKRNLLILYSLTCLFFRLQSYNQVILLFFKNEVFPIIMHLKHIFHMSHAGRVCILGHNCSRFDMDNTQVGVVKQANQIGLICLQKNAGICTLGAQICWEVLSNFLHLMLEGKFAREFSVLLVFTDSHSTRLGMMWFLHPFSISLYGLFAGILLGRSLSIENSLLFGRSSANQRCQRGLMSLMAAAAVAATENTTRNVFN